MEMHLLTMKKMQIVEKKARIQKWSTALSKASNLSGWPIDEQYETNVLKEIIDDIIRRLNHNQPLNVGKNIVGMSFHLEKLKSLMNEKLNEVCVVGICGIGGIGKTTIAMAIYNELSNQYDGSSFLRKVKERSEGGTLQLQHELLQGILRGKSLKLSNIDEGVKMIRRILSLKRVLIVFDDVDNLKQLEYLAEEQGWFGAKSTIIITTRDKSLLAQYGVNIEYEVTTLNEEEAVELFSLWAFQQNLPNKVDQDLLYAVVRYAKGLPLALEVLGSNFFDMKTKEEWKSALEKLKKSSDERIYSVLRTSYDGLDSVDKDIFLDIACFFKGNDKDFVSRILGPYAKNGIRTLEDKCLITISANMLDMHDMVQQMGWKIVHQECPKDPGRRSRLWGSDAELVLTKNTGTQAIEGLFVEISTLEHIEFTPKAFEKMNTLRLLKVYQEAIYDSMIEPWMDINPNEMEYLELPLPRKFKFPFLELRYLHWDGYSLPYLPKNFNAKNLVELSLRGSQIKQLWEGKKLLDKLKVINLSYSLNLIEFPDFSSVPNLEILTLEGCRSLKSLPSSFDKFKCLQSLSCGGCSKLMSFPEINGNMGKLREFNFSGTSISEVPSSIEHLNGLEELLLEDCKKLVAFSENIGSLSSLKSLKLKGCSKLKGLPSSINHLKALKNLDLSNCKNLVRLAASISSLTSVKTRVDERPLSQLVSLGKGGHMEEFSLQELRQATDNFSVEHRIGTGSFGSVYLATLEDGKEVAIKRAEVPTTSLNAVVTRLLDDKDIAFANELSILSQLNHRNLVRLLGYCEDYSKQIPAYERILVYEYMNNGSLYDHLHRLPSSPLKSWTNRLRVALDAARGIEYLHVYAVPQIIHRDIKSSNILLDDSLRAKVSDFGLSLMGHEDEDSHLSLHAAGTVGYIDPEYYRLQQLTTKSDVYSFGVLLLELLSGRKAIHKNENGVPRNVVDFVVPYIVQDEIHRVLDPNVPPPTLNEIEVVAYIGYIAADCVSLEGRDRPSMSDIVHSLERALAACFTHPSPIPSPPISRSTSL